MSLLMFVHEEESVLVITDTLATSGGNPFMFQSKVFFFPHANMVMAVTGVANVGERWAAQLRSSAVFRDIADIDTFATTTLQAIEREILGEQLGQPGMTTTIYHFGFEPDSTRPVRYIYRSTDGFKTERHEPSGFGVKPEPEPGFKAPDTLDDIITMATDLKALWEAKPDPIYIGGELYLTTVQNWQQASVRIHRFPDYDDAWESMLALMKKNASS